VLNLGLSKLQSDFLMKRFAPIKAKQIFTNLYKNIAKLRPNFSLSDNLHKLNQDPVGKYLLLLNLPSKNRFEKLDKLISQQNKAMRKILVKEKYDTLMDIANTNKFFLKYEKEIEEIYKSNMESYEFYIKELAETNLNTETVFDTSSNYDESTEDMEEFDFDVDEDEKSASFYDKDFKNKFDVNEDDEVNKFKKDHSFFLKTKNENEDDIISHIEIQDVKIINEININIENEIKNENEIEKKENIEMIENSSNSSDSKISKLKKIKDKEKNKQIKDEKQNKLNKRKSIIMMGINTLFGKHKLSDEESDSSKSSSKTQIQKESTFYEYEKFEIIINEQLKIINRITNKKYDTLFQIENVNIFISYFEKDLRNFYLDSENF
jgi:hypothetical protein